MTSATGRNDPCPCGSGRKYKRCCLDRDRHPPAYTRADRDAALRKLERYTEDSLGPEDDLGISEFFDQLPDVEEHELAAYASQVGEEVYDWWFWFDRPLDDGSLVVDRFLADKGSALVDRERRYLELVRESCLRLYEVVDTLPGETVTLQEALDGSRVTVVERTASRSLERGTLVAARVIPGPAHAPAMIEAGFFAFPNLSARQMVEQTREFLRQFLASTPGAPASDFFKALVPALHRAWVELLVDPPIPHLANTDGEDLLWTTVHFDVLDLAALTAALDALPELQWVEDERAWGWEGANAEGKLVTLGRLEPHDGELVLEANSRERGERGRQLVESAAGDAVRFRIASHQAIDIAEGLAPGSGPGQPSPDENDLPPEVAEELVLTQYALHYHGWLDEPVPALAGRTPREAAADPEHAGEVESLIRGLEGMYERALREGLPAYDPSWMRQELALGAPSPSQHPPPLAHERWAAAVPGWDDACSKAAWAIRNRASFDERRTVAYPEDLERDIEVQRLLRRRQAVPDLLTQLRYGVSFELHRRKVFWVDEALAFLLGKTDLAVDGGHLRVPFPAFAMVFTDRPTLSLAERLVAADSSCPIRGRLVRVATVYVVEEGGGEERTLHLGFALDTGGADPPHLVEHQVRAVEGEPVVVAPPSQLDPAEPGADLKPALPLGGLLTTTLNAILYAVSPASEKVPRQAPSAPSRTQGTGAVFASDDVFYLPGPISISHSRQLESLERVPGGRTLMTRFMVRGHWRRPAESWKDQSMRWIKPYWKGPEIAAVVERAYRLEA